MKCNFVFYLIVSLSNCFYKATSITHRKLRLFLISLGLYPVINFNCYIALWCNSILLIVLHSRYYGFPALYSPAPALRSLASGLQNPGNFSYRTFLHDTGTLMDNLWWALQYAGHQISHTVLAKQDTWVNNSNAWGLPGHPWWLINCTENVMNTFITEN